MIIDKTVKYKGHELALDELKPSSKIPISVQCDTCGKVFSSTKYQITRNGHQLCRPCAIRLKEEKQIPIGSKFGRLTVISPGQTAGYSLCKCKCGKSVSVWNANLRSGNTKSCGCIQKEIAGKHLKNLDKFGSNHPNWKGGITDKRHIIESRKDYKDFRQSVFQRDNNACVKCLSPNNIETHHVLNFSSNPDLIMDSSNVVTLCHSCHQQFHKIYGKKNNTKAQFDEFMSWLPFWL